MKLLAFLLVLVALFLRYGPLDNLSTLSTLSILKDRMEMIRRATFDDAFIIKFSEQTPLKLIKLIKPNILIKGGDYKANEIVGSDFIKKNKGEVKIIPFVKGCSSSNIINKIIKSSD